MPAERLQKVLAAAGVASRRGAESMIAAGRVTVDGRVATLGTQADPDRSIIAVDGRVIGAAAAHGYLLLHKPVPNEVLRNAIARLMRRPAVNAPAA